jgi:hypothetical protein
MQGLDCFEIKNKEERLLYLYICVGLRVPGNFVTTYIELKAVFLYE